jgi:hypothetical protein
VRIVPSYLVAVLMGLLLAVAVIALAQQEQKAPAAAAPTLAPEPPAVAALPYKYETEYEVDPFDRTLLRRTKTTVTHIMVVRADGSTTIKAAD